MRPLRDFVVFRFVERVDSFESFEFILRHIEERRNVYLKYSKDRSLPFACGSKRIRALVS